MSLSQEQKNPDLVSRFFGINIFLAKSLIHHVFTAQEISERILRPSLAVDFVMKMRSGGVTGVPHRTHDVTSFYMLATPYGDAGKVGINRSVAI